MENKEDAIVFEGRKMGNYRENGVFLLKNIKRVRNLFLTRKNSREEKIEKYKKK